MEPVAPFGNLIAKHEALERRYAGVRPRTLAFGDSRAKAIKLDGIGEDPKANLGLAGDRTAVMLWRAMHCTTDLSCVNLAVIAGGINDLRLPRPHRRTPAEIAEGLGRITAVLRRRIAPGADIVLAAVWPTLEEGLADYRPGDLRDLNSMISRIPGTTFFEVPLRPEDYREDMLHLRKEVYSTKVAPALLMSLHAD